MVSSSFAPTPVKKLAAELIWRSTQSSFAMRRLVRPLGMRINYRWIGERSTTVQMPNGTAIELCDVGQNYLAFELHWKGWQYLSPFTVLTARELLRDAQTFFDIGANIGYYALLAASEKQNVEITAFEPNSANF